MSRTGWKQFERCVAKALGGRRYPANMGGPVDVGVPELVAPEIIVQCKEVKRGPLPWLEREASAIADVGFQQHAYGIVVVKRSAGAGVKTTPLVVMTLDVWCALERARKETACSIET